MTTKYSDKFKKNFSYTRKISEFCGGDVIKDDYKMCWRTFAVAILITLALCFTFYSNYIELYGKGDWSILLKSTAIIGTGIKGLSKLINGIKQQENFRYLYQEICKTYETYERKDSTYKDCLKNNISLVNKLLKTLFLIVLIATVGVTVVPLYSLIVLNKRVDILPFALPFVDSNTNFGFYFTFFVHTFCVFLGGFGNFVVDSWLFIFTAQVPLMKNILQCKFNDLDGILKENSKCLEKSKDPLIDIFKWHQKYNNYCNVIRNTFFWVIFIQVGFELLGIVSTVVCIFMGIWPPAPSFLLYLFSVFYSYCALGNFVEVANDDIIFIIYDCCWYNLTVSEQKMILIMLRVSQNAKSISIGGVAPLSLNTALQLTKTVYTLSMVLKKYFD